MNSESKAAWILVVTTALAGLGWIFSKETIQGLPPFGFVGLRFLVASVCLLPFCFKSFKQLNLRLLAQAMGGGCILALALLAWVHAIAVSETLGEGAFIVSLSMIIVPIVAWALYKERPKRAFWIAMPIAVSGLAFLSLKGEWNSSAGQLWFLANACLLALHFNVNSRLAQSMPVLMLTCLQLFATGIIALVASAIFETVPVSVNSSIWAWFAASAILATSLRYVMQTLGQKHSNPGNAALIMLLEPIWTVILSILWYGEQLSSNKLLGCCLILLALLFYRTDGRLFRLKR
ncbi:MULTISPECIES: DMT family transporter [Vibrio]|uniref:DMT family transporter n=1 Tax=Vibrio TaxID=662 RepID=UPI0020750D5B|nr:MULTISPECIES: DMT family transporter [Vibrio]USD34057.1 DMT family transporter [Vibrio sp. SCSIO 43186]USD47127.1 DMT family transporter [Vibrio sp. SCSIO 43145]USD71181.1 DMT family transporter [Vibrio sp. SCSIO 43139]USD97466.1 EamA family transporter [Vibrio coralliilyticus]